MEFIDNFFLLNDKSKYKCIEGLRAFAVLMVFNVHFFGQFYQKDYFFSRNSAGYFLARILHAGHIGVDIFFVISGFLIYRNLFAKKPNPVIFLKHRVLRLLPSHIFALLVVSYSTLSLIQFLGNVMFLPSFLSQFHNYNYVTWSLGWEWLFYIVILLIGLASGYRIFPAFLLMIGFIALNSVVQYYITSPKILVPDAFRFSSFFLGCAVAAFREKKQIQLNKMSLNIVAIASLVSILICSTLWAAYAGHIQESAFLRSAFYVCVGLIASILLLALLSGESILSRFFSLKILRIIGEMSYSFYLTHAMIGIPFANHLAGVVTSASGMIAAYFISIIVTSFIAAFFYYYTERDYFLNRKAALVPIAPQELIGVSVCN